ncbi:hypothetical protein ACUOFC_37150, partial [Escherichia sp. TWPC-MK]
MKSALKKSVVSTSISLILASGMAEFTADRRRYCHY